MYIGKSSIILFHAFIDGYTFAKQEANEEISDWSLMVSFQKKVAKRYSITSSHGWSSILLFQAGDEAIALDLFWKLWNEHIEKTNKKAKRK